MVFFLVVFVLESDPPSLNCGNAALGSFTRRRGQGGGIVPADTESIFGVSKRAEHIVRDENDVFKRKSFKLKVRFFLSDN